MLNTRTTKEHLDIVVGSGKVFRDLLLRHKPDTPGPTRRGVVQNIVNLESPGIFIGQVIELLLEEDIFIVDVCINEAQFSGILGILEGGADDLEHGCDTRPASNHANFTSQCSGVVELAFRTLDANVVADFEQGNVAGDIAFLIRLGP